MTDDELLERLAAAFDPEPSEPPMASIYALRRAVAASRTPVRALPRRRWVVPALGGLSLVAVSSLTLVATGAVLPQPIRQVAHTVGLPVDSPKLAEARAARAGLRHGLARGDHAEVAREAARLRAGLEVLSANEREEVEHDADRLLHQADVLLTPGRSQENERDEGSQHQGSEPGGEDQAPTTTSPGGTSSDQPGEGPGSESDSEDQAPTTTAPGGASSDQPGEGPGSESDDDQSASGQTMTWRASPPTNSD